MTAAVILAAGASTRMGSPKAFLEYKGETFAARLVRLLRTHCDDIVLVTRQPVEVAGARTVVNPEPERGMLSSLQCGLAAVLDADAVVFTPVDIPAIDPATLDRVIGEWRGDLLRIPRCGGRRGHPVLVARSLIAEFAELGPEAQARDVVERHAKDIVYVDVDDPGILADVDTPADYEKLHENR